MSSIPQAPEALEPEPEFSLTASEADLDDPAETPLVESKRGFGGAWFDRIQYAPLSAWITFVIVAGCAGFAFWHVQPGLIFTENTPTGGDMGAHVWAPAYLRDVLLPDFRLTGWTPDWYAGFPALQFYFVPPMLAIVLLDLFVPYGIAFKIVVVSGIVALPVAAWFFGRMAGLPFPAPALFAVAAVGFLFDSTYRILGGNVLSTMAGEFSFTISLALALVYLGLVANGLQTGRHRAAAAIVVALCALCHAIPLIFAVVGTFLLLALYPARASVRWIATAAPVGALLAAWWLVPFWFQRHFMNDMGWEKKLPPADAGFWEEMGFWATRLFPQDTRWIAYLAMVGFALALARRAAPALFLAGMLILGCVGFVILPQGQLWNERLLPFVHLCTYVLAAYGASEVIRWVADAAEDRARDIISAVGAVVVSALALGVVSMFLWTLPFGSERDGEFRFLAFSTAHRNPAPGWAQYNFTGLEGRVGWNEYEDLVLTMDNIGERDGCGRAFWEFNAPVLDAYGTSMALMLLPFWTDGCIASFKGLYFESASTTPYHFLAQAHVSTSPSNAQRGLPYQGFDINTGVEQLQLLGVTYYMAVTEEAIEQARWHPDLTEIAQSGPWVIFEVADAPLVVPLANEPVIVPIHDAGHEWTPMAADWFQSPFLWDLHWASNGPDGWQRTENIDGAERRSQAPVEVTNIESGTDWVRFEVSEPGTPVLVKVSYFPNWRANGADGPWRVTPNFMVVIPTDTTVELHYGRSTAEIAGWGLSGIGIVLVVLLFRSPALTMPTWVREEQAPEPESPTTLELEDAEPDAIAADDPDEPDQSPST